jgi:hypothetical protein
MVGGLVGHDVLDHVACRRTASFDQGFKFVVGGGLRFHGQEHVLASPWLVLRKKKSQPVLGWLD